MKNKTISVWLFTAALSLSFPTFSFSQDNKDNKIYVKAENMTLIGKAASIDQYYHRVDTVKYNEMPPAVKKLFTNSAGLGVVFKTNSKSIGAKWSVKSPKAGNNLLPIMQKGLDLYIKRDGKWVHAGVARPVANKTEYTSVIVSNMIEGEKECLLYFPLYV